jgi:hypothetical protein
MDHSDELFSSSATDGAGQQQTKQKVGRKMEKREMQSNPIQ